MIYPDVYAVGVAPQGAVLTILYLERNTNDVFVNVERAKVSDFGGPRTAAAIDAATWEALLLVYDILGRGDLVRLISVETVQVGGEDAVKRVHRAPDLFQPSVILHKITFTVRSGSAVYIINVNGLSQGAIARSEINEMIGAVEFLR